MGFDKISGKWWVDWGECEGLGIDGAEDERGKQLRELQVGE